MPELKNRKHEAFARLLAANAGRREFIATAYRAAGYEAKNDRSALVSGERLLRIAAVAARVSELRPKADATVQEMVAPLVAQEVQNRVGRVAILARDLAATEDIIRERARADENQGVPGGKTGLVIVRSVVKGSRKTFDPQTGKMIKSEPDYQPEGVVAHNLIQCRAALLDQIAAELGQKMDKRQQVPMTMEELKALPIFDEFLAAAAAEVERLGIMDDEQEGKAN